MAPFKGWLNPSYTLASSKASCQRLVNLFAEVIESGDEKAVGYLRGCPGLTKIATIPSTGSTGTFKFRGLLAGGSPLNPLSGASGRIFAVVGSLLFELDHTGTPINGIGGNAYRGDVGNDGLPVQMFPNGNQLGIVSNGQFWIDNGAGPVAPTFPGSTYTDISVGWGGTFTTTPWGFRSGGMAFGTGRPGRGGGRREDRGRQAAGPGDGAHQPA